VVAARQILGKSYRGLVKRQDSFLCETVCKFWS